MAKAMKLSGEKELSKAYDFEMIPVELPHGIDPDDFVSQYGFQELIVLLKKSQNKFR